MFLKNIAEDLIISISKCIDLCSQIMSEIRVSETEFTLHDLHHSFNVIDLMGQLIKNKEDLSVFEIGFLIYSALLHDIGMINWENDTITSEKIRLNHGKRTFEFIKKGYLFENSCLPFSFGLYDSLYRQYLPELCQSHMEDIAFIECFSRNLIVDSQKIDLLFCAILLRLADAMDLNNNRAPYSLYKLLKLNEISDDHWKKHMRITNCKIDENGYYRVDGTCEDIMVFRIILKDFLLISEELKKSFSILLKKGGTLILAVMKETVNNQIQKKGFMIWDNKITLDYFAITKLFMGAQLYGNNRAGLREIMQNAIDACMIRDSITKKDATSESYTPEIIISYKNEKIYIKDNGTGMSKNIIENYFLNIGISYYHTSEFIEKKLEYHPVGYFGIGFLSCFMLSNRILVRTASYEDDKEYYIHFVREDPFVLIEVKNKSNFIGTEIIFQASEFLKVFENEFERETIYNVLDNVSSYIKYYFWNLLPNESLEVLKYKITRKTFSQHCKCVCKGDMYVIDLNRYLNDVEGYIFMNDERGLLDMWRDSGKEIYSFLDALKNGLIEINGNMKLSFPFCNNVLFFDGNKLKEIDYDDNKIYDDNYVIGFLGYNPNLHGFSANLTLLIHKDIFKVYVAKTKSTFYNRVFGYYESSSFRVKLREELFNYCGTGNTHVYFLLPQGDCPYLTLINNVIENELKDDIIELYLKSTRIGIFRVRKIWNLFCINKIMINVTNNRIEPQASRNELIEQSSDYIENAIEIVKYLWVLENIQDTNVSSNTIDFYRKPIIDLWNSSNPLLKEEFRPK